MGLTKEQKKDYQRDYMRNRRSNKTGLTNDGSNNEGLTFLGNPIKCPESITLSDGQVFHPEPRYWNRLEREIEYLVERYPNKEKRVENAIRYKEWINGR